MAAGEVDVCGARATPLDRVTVDADVIALSRTIPMDKVSKQSMRKRPEPREMRIFREAGRERLQRLCRFCGGFCGPFEFPLSFLVCCFFFCGFFFVSFPPFSFFFFLCLFLS